MKCPRCGADNAEQAEWCYLCEYRFSGEPGAAMPEGGAAAGTAPAIEAPGEAASPPYSAPPQAVQPPPAPAGRAPFPGALPPGIRPSPAGKRVPRNVFALVLVVALAVIAAGLLAFFLLRGRTYTIKVDPPPGYSRADEDMVREAEKGLADSAKGVSLDEVFIDDSRTNFVFVLHQDVPFSDAPSGKDPDEMEKYFYDHKDEWTEAFSSGMLEAQPDLNPRLEKYEVIRLAGGEAALHMTTSIGIQQYAFTVDTLWIIKESSAFAIVVEGLDPNGVEVIEFMRQNVTFE